MNDKNIHLVLVSIAGSWGSRRNSGNFRDDEIPALQEAIQRSYVKMEDDNLSHNQWVALTETGSEKLLELNRKFSKTRL